MKLNVNIEMMTDLFLEEGTSSVYAKEIYEKIQTGKVRIHSPFTIAADDILNTYTIRERIQREVTRKEVVLGYDVVLPNLANEEKALVAVFHVSTQDSGYLVFANETLTRIVGILKLPFSNFEKDEAFGKESRKSGLEDSGETFEKGKRIVK
jgi:hypothetical protein